MYAHAAVDYHNAEFFEQAFLGYKERNQTPTILELGYMAQAAACLRRSEYTALLLRWLDELLTEQ